MNDMTQQRSREIFGRLNLVRRDLWMIAAAALGALAVAALIALPVQTHYRSTSTVGLDPGAEGANERVDFVADVRAAVFQPSVLGAVAADVGLDDDRLRDDLSVERVEDSNLIRIVYDTSDADEDVARAVVTSVPEGAIGFLNSGELDAAERAMSTAQQAYDDADDKVAEHRQRVNEALAANDFIRPDAEVETIRGDLGDAQLSLLGLDEEEDADQIEATNAVIDDLEAELDSAARDAAEFVELESELEIAIEDRRELALVLNEARRNVAAASDAPTVTVQTVSAERSSKRLAIVQLIGLPVLVALATAWALSWYRQRRRSDVAPG